MTLALKEFHQAMDAHFSELNGDEIVTDFGDPMGEYRALTETAGVMDFSFRGRLCVTGADRKRWLNGQVSNDVNALAVGQGCYAALVSGKGRIQSDFNVFMLAEEILLDFEPGLAGPVTKRLESYMVADDVQIVDASGAYGLLSVQGPKAAEVIGSLGLEVTIPEKRFAISTILHGTLGEIYLANHPRLNTAGFDLFVPTQSLGALMDRLILACKNVGGRWRCGMMASSAASAAPRPPGAWPGPMPAGAMRACRGCARSSWRCILRARYWRARINVGSTGGARRRWRGV